MPATRSWRAALVAACLLLLAGTVVVGPAAAADPGRLSGTVTDDDGARLHGASVRLLDGSGGVVAQANAGADGRYQLGAPQAPYRLVVTHAHEGGWLEAQVGNVTVGSASELDVVAVAPPVHLRVRVDVGELAGSSVVVSLVGHDHTYSASAPTDGAYDVAVEPGRYRLRVRVNLPWAWESDGSLWVESVETLDVTSDRTLDLRLPVTWVRIGTPDTGGALRPGQSIHISSGPVPAPAVSIGAGLSATPSFKTSGVTDSSGFARIPALPTPALDASFSPPAKNPDHYEADLVELSYSISGIDARAAETEVRFDPKPLVSLAGRFTDGAGNSLGDGYIELSGPNGVAETFIRVDGTFTTRVPTGRYSVKFTGRTGYGFVNLSLPDVDLTADRVTTFRLPLHASTVLVRGADNPVPDATLLGGTGDGARFGWTPVATEYPGSTARVQLAPLRTDLSGRTTVVAPPGAPLTVSVRPPTGLNLGSVTAVVAADATTTTVHLPDGGTVSGRLRSTLGHGHPDVGLTVTDNPAILPAFTTSDGTFSLHATPGPARLTLRQGTPATDSTSDLPDHWSLAGNVMLDPGQPLDLLLSSPSTDLRFVDGDGQPLPVRAVASADVSGVVTGAGIFAGQAESHTRCCTPSDRLSVRSFGGATGSVHVGTQDGTVLPHSWIRATGVPLAAGGRVTLALATPTSDPGGAIRPSSTTTTTTTTTTTRPSDPPSGDGSTTTTTAPSDTSTAGLPTGSGGSGYWMVTAAGAVHAFGDAKHYGEPTGSLGGAQAVRLEPTPTGRGYRVLDHRGVVHAYGDASHHGNVNRAGLAAGELPTSLSGTPTGKGYWVFTTRGRVLTFGDAAFYGDVSSLTLNGPVLGSVATPTGRGYYMVASDGGIFTFGDARFHGSTGNLKLNKPVMGMAPAGDGSGYWLVASDGGIFSFSVPFHGSLGSVPLNKPISGIVPGRGGYLMVAEDGGIFSFGQVAFHGSLGATPPASPVVSAALLP